MSEHGNHSIEEYVVELRKNDLARGILRINSEIFDGPTNIWLQEIDNLQLAHQKELTVKISSPGGSAYYAIALYDALNELRQSGTRITTKVEGYAASAAVAFILQASDWRVAGPHSRLLVHEVRGSSSGRFSDMKDEQDEMFALSDMMLKILVERTGKPEEFWVERISHRDRWIGAKEALEVGLIDEIR